MTSVEPGDHYDRVNDAWLLLLGEEFHYGVFDTGDETLAQATARLTDLMLEGAALEEGHRLLDVGCGTGTTACRVAASHGVEIVGISTSQVGVDAARRRADSAALGSRVSFEVRDALDTGLPPSSFDRVWALESSHLMRDKAKLLKECSRVLRPGGRLVLCDIVLRRTLAFEEVRARRKDLAVLRDVFGDAHMEPPNYYVETAASLGFGRTTTRDLTAATRPTFDRWRENAERHESEVTELVGREYLDTFVKSTDVLRSLWDEGILGYGLVTADAG